MALAAPTLPDRLFVGGDWRTAATSFEVEDPATGAPFATVADSRAADAVDALDAAAAAQPRWADLAPSTRAAVLARGATMLLDRLDEFAHVMTLEMGKPIAESRAEIRYAAAYLHWFAEEAVRVGGRFGPAPGGGAAIATTRQPVGPCLAITPWNFPLAMGARKIGPAFAAGCTMIVKPAPQTPLSMLLLATALDAAGTPAGVLSVLPTTRAADVAGALLEDERLRKLTFTGSTRVGRDLLRQAADGVLRTSMELGGNAPFVVFADANLGAAVDGAVTAKMRNMGEACTAANRFLVADELVDDFASALADRMGSLVVGPGLDPASEVGPLIDERQLARVAALVEDARSRGARILTGGRVLDGPGYFYAPTVLRDVPANAPLLEQEIFGPVAPIVGFDGRDDNAVVDAANATPYGLAAYVYTRDLDRARVVCERLDTGMVGLNTGLVSDVSAPFGGIKASGFGREGGREGIDEYLQTKLIAIARN